MKAVDRLRRDHAILRSKLDVLEAALGMGSETWFVLREVCFTLSRQLRDHIRREEALVVACRKAMVPPPAGVAEKRPAALRPAAGEPAGGGMDPKVLAEVAVEHKDEPAHLRTVNRLFVSQAGHSLDQIKPALTEVIQGLRHHMAEEERELFPILERMLADQESRETAAAPSPIQLNEEMTVNRIVQQFPRTKPVFERLFINVPMEGCACLDEVAWRHGMESRELLERLGRAIASCECTRREPGKGAEAMAVESERVN